MQNSKIFCIMSYFWKLKKKYQNKGASGCYALDIKNFGEFMAKFWHYAKVWPSSGLLCKTLKVFASYQKFS